MKRPKYLLQQVRAKHDTSGNPRRWIVVYRISEVRSEGNPHHAGIAGVFDDGYANGRVDAIWEFGGGVNADMEEFVDLPSYDVTASEWRWLAGLKKTLADRAALHGSGAK